MASNFIVHYFDPATGEYVESMQARESPREPGVPLVPRFATLTVPPSPQPGYTRCWRDGAWVQVEDHRGQTVYSTEDGREIVIQELGPLPDNVTTEPRPSPFHRWQDGQWVEDTEAAQQALLYQFEAAIQAHIDATARQRTYRNGDACATYVSSTNPQWAAEAAAFVAWRDAVWAHAFTELDKVQQGLRAQPTVEEFLLELPVMQWPEPD